MPWSHRGCEPIVNNTREKIGVQSVKTAHLCTLTSNGRPDFQLKSIKFSMIEYKALWNGYRII